MFLSFLFFFLFCFVLLHPGNWPGSDRGSISCHRRIWTVCLEHCWGSSGITTARTTLTRSSYSDNRWMRRSLTTHWRSTPTWHVCHQEWSDISISYWLILCKNFNFNQYTFVFNLRNSLYYSIKSFLELISLKFSSRYLFSFNN